MRKKTLIFSILLSLLAWVFGVNFASAAALSSMSDKMSNLNPSTASNHTITFTTPTGVAAGQTITVTFPAGFTIGSVDYTDIDVSDDGVDLTLAATASGATWGAAFAGQVLTVTSGTGTIAAASVVVIEIGTNATSGATGDQQITNPTAGTKIISIAGTFGDTGSMAVVIAASTTTVSAAIEPTLTFSLSTTTIDLGTLTAASISTAPSDPHLTLSASTNAGSGYTIYVQDQGNGTTAGLYKSATPTKLITSSAATLAAGTEGYGLSGQVASGAGTVNAAYNFTNASNQVGALSRTATALATNTAATASDTYLVKTKAAISSTTSAGSYSDTQTYTITATF